MGDDLDQKPEVNDDSGRERPVRVLLRLPLSLHRALKELARCDGVSLNTYIVTIMAADAGSKRRRIIC